MKEFNVDLKKIAIENGWSKLLTLEEISSIIIDEIGDQGGLSGGIENISFFGKEAFSQKGKYEFSQGETVDIERIGFYDEIKECMLSLWIFG